MFCAFCLRSVFFEQQKNRFVPANLRNSSILLAVFIFCGWSLGAGCDFWFTIFFIMKRNNRETFRIFKRQEDRGGNVLEVIIINLHDIAGSIPDHYNKVRFFLFFLFFSGGGSCPQFVKNKTKRKRNYLWGTIKQSVIKRGIPVFLKCVPSSSAI